MRVLVTGADGFVGRHLCRVLAAEAYEVLTAPPPSAPDGLELTNPASVHSVVTAARPDAVVHLAAVSSVAESHRDPIHTFTVNALGTTHLLDAMHRACPAARLLLVSSGEVYGRLPPGTAAVETMPVAPLNPYAASKAAAETLALQFYRSYGTDVVCARSYGHVGPGQAAHFVVPSFAEQIAAIGRGDAEPVIRTGDLSPVRDFSHVRDVVAGYELLLRAGLSGEVYNVASGRGRTVRSLLDEMLELSGVDARVELDPSRVRPVEIPELVGDPSRLRALGWVPSRDVRSALREVLVEHAALPL